MIKKKIAILGSTGSIGTQTLMVCDEHPELFEPYILTANNNVDKLIEQSRQYQPDSVVIANESLYDVLKEALADLPIKVYAGEVALSQVVTSSEVDIVLTALVGFSGLLPTINAIQAGKTIALANKETLVVAGELIGELALRHKSLILPVDSEHSAIFQCLQGASGQIEKILLTASGGPFRTYNHEDLAYVTKVQALKHPRWEMGAKITIDSATMMNKGFEVIEAKWLFNLNAKQIEVVVHPESIIHSAVQFDDGCIIAQMGAPNMQLPIQFALGFPQRLPHKGDRISLFDLQQLTFEQPDLNKFRCLSLAYDAMNQGGNVPCILNAANEVVNRAFLDDKINFMQIPDIIERVMAETPFAAQADLQTYLETDAEARQRAAAYII